MKLTHQFTGQPDILNPFDSFNQEFKFFRHQGQRPIAAVAHQVDRHHRQPVIDINLLKLRRFNTARQIRHYAQHLEPQFLVQLSEIDAVNKFDHNARAPPVGG